MHLNRQKLGMQVTWVIALFVMCNDPFNKVFSIPWLFSLRKPVYLVVSCRLSW